MPPPKGPRREAAPRKLRETLRPRDSAEPSPGNSVPRLREGHVRHGLALRLRPLMRAIWNLHRTWRRPCYTVCLCWGLSKACFEQYCTWLVNSAVGQDAAFC